MSPIGAVIGGGVKKVSWRVGRSGFSQWHVVFAERDGEVRTACNIAVPPKQNVPRNFITTPVAVADACERCWPDPGGYRDDAA